MIYGFDSSAHASEKAAFDKIASALAPLGIEAMPGEGSPESDIGPMTRNGMAWAWLGHDGTHYFDLHHNAEDHLDKIEPEARAQNGAAYTVSTDMDEPPARALRISHERHVGTES